MEGVYERSRGDLVWSKFVLRNPGGSWTYISMLRNPQETGYGDSGQTTLDLDHTHRCLQEQKYTNDACKDSKMFTMDINGQIMKLYTNKNRSSFLLLRTIIRTTDTTITR